MKAEISNILKKIDWKLWAAFLLIFLLYIPAAILDDIPQRDVAYRYAPAAEAFARGDWLYAFHPRMQVLHPAFSGILVSLFSISGFLAAKLSGLFFYALGIFPLYKLLQEVFCKKIAYWGILAYVFASRILLLSYSGLRESHKQLVILLLALGVILVYKYRDRLKGYLIMGLASGLAVCTRNDMILFTVILFAVCALLEVYRQIIPWKTILGAFFSIILSLPELIVNYKITGYVIPGARFLSLYEQAFHHLPTLSNVLLVSSVGFVCSFFIILPVIGWIIRKKYGRIAFFGILSLAAFLVCIKIFTGDIQTDENYTFANFLEGIYRGQFPFMFFLLLPGLFYRIFRKKMTVPEILLLSAYLLHGILIILLILGCDKYLYISSRYLSPATPLFFGWIGITAMLIWKILSKIPVIVKFRLGISWLAVVTLAAVLYADAYSPVIKYYRKKKLASVKEQLYTIAGHIRNDYKGERYWTPKFDLSTYFPNNQPTVWFADDWKICASGYLSGGSACMYLKDAKYAVTYAAKPLRRSDFEKMGDPISSKEGTLQIWRRK
ncbi:MAG: glycosyltransferase family 39 protein [Lentisphaeria bacterium]|nr:glycosyltransferase family 39 protein [Lentisphaeria bacterium]